jgi:hypothetical protein
MIANLCFKALFVLFSLGINADGFSFCQRSLGSTRGGVRTSSVIIESSPTANNELSRTLFLSDALGIASALMIASCPNPAFAGDDSSLKGTKTDPKFQACLSLCMYECTKPKGSEQRSRSECLPECKQKCATTKQQLLLGSPKE